MLASARGGLWIFAGAVCLSFAAIFVALADLGPTATAFHRFLGATLLLGAWAAITRPKRVFSRGGTGMFVLAGLALAFDMGIWNRSIGILGPGLATLVVSTQVLLVPVLAALLLKAVPPRGIMAPALLCVVGIATFSFPTEHSHAGELLGVGLGLVAALSYATYIVLLKGGADRDDSPAPLKLLIVCVTGTIALGVAAPALGESLVIPNLKTLLAIIGMAAVVQIGGWLLILRGMKTTSATSAGLVLVAQPVLAMVWDSLFFARPFGLRELLGGTLTLIAIIWGTWLANRATPTS